jgi:LmbE family N-acetylglucosaminyl deacetylase
VAVGLPLAASAAEAASPQQAQTAQKWKIIVTGGHPGDPEYGCGGTVARFSEQGHEVVLLYLNRGEYPEKPVDDDHSVRVAEARKACGILGARPRFAGQIDGKAIVDPAHYDQFHQLVASEKPNAVFTHWPIDNHADHRAISMMTYEAWLRMKKSFALFYYEVSNGEDTLQFAPTHYVDISRTEPRKRSGCYAHASQAPDRFYSLQQLVTRMRGLESGHPQAEAFIRHVQSPEFALPGPQG